MEVDDDTNSNTSDDPVVAEYNIFITPQMQEQLYLLQYPTRERKQPYTAANAALPNELRIKPKIGFVEVDIGVTTAANFDKIKGLQWGQALKHAKDSKAKGFGLSSGFGKGNEEGNMKVLVSGDGEGRRRKDDGDVDDMLREFETKKERGGVLVKQTLGGQIKRPEEGKPFYMCGTFRGNELHFTEITGIAQMRPQFHHIDAQAQITKTTLSRATTSTSASGAKPKTLRDQQPQTAALATQRGKDTETQVPTSYEATDNFLNAAADENWTRLGYRDEEEPEAFALFDETMIVRDVEGAKLLQADWGTARYLKEINPTIAEEEEERKKREEEERRKRDVRKGKSGRKGAGDAGAGTSRRL